MSDSSSKRPEQAEDNPLDPRDIAADEVLGGRQWRRSKIGYITGLGTMRDSAESTLRNGMDATGRLKSLSSAAFRSDKSGRKVDDAITDPAERFAAAMVVNGKSEANIRKSIETTYLQFWTYAVLLGLTVVAGIVTLMAYGLTFPRFPLLDILFRAAPIPILGALLVRAGYTNWMFRKRHLLSIQDYFRAGDLLPVKKKTPAKATPMKSTGRTLKSVIVAMTLLLPLMMALQVDPAFAQIDPEANARAITADPESSDYFINILSYMLPNVGPVPAINGDNGFAMAARQAFMVFSGTLLFIGGMVAGWQIMSSLVASAKEGTVLGKQYHEVWAPARVAIGFGMLVPIAGGLCAAQILVVYLIVWGGNLANVVWTPYVNAITDISGEIEGSDGQPAFQALMSSNLTVSNSTVQNIFEKELCHATIKVYNDRVGPAARTGTMIVDNPQWVRNDHTRALYNNRQVIADKWVLDYGPVCGAISTVTWRADTSRPENHVKHIISQAQETQIKAIREGILESTIPLVAATSYQSPEASTVRYFSPDNNTSALVSNLNSFRHGYSSAIGAVIMQANQYSDPYGGSSGQLEAIRRDTADAGWAAAGVFYVTIARLQNAIYSQASSGATYTQMNDINPGNFSRFIGEYLYGTDTNPGGIPMFRTWWKDNIEQIAPDISSQAITTESGTDAWSLLNPVFMFVMDWWKWGENTNPLNPMQHMIDLGNQLMLGGTAVYGLTLAAEYGGTTGKNIANVLTLGISGLFTEGATNALANIMGLARMFALAIIAAGAIHAYVLPMIPYIMTAFFVGGMVILTVEALVAAPLWAFFHVRFDGQDFISEVQKPGYMIAFNLLLRPALMIFGLILSYLVFGGMAWFVEKTFFSAAEGLTGSMGVGPIGIIVMIVMVTYIHYQMAIRAFSLITQVPDRVTRWFGQGGERLGEEEDGNKTSGLIVAQTTNRMEGMARGAALGSRKPPKPLVDRKNIPGGPPGETGAQPPGGGGGGGGSPALGSGTPQKPV